MTKFKNVMRVPKVAEKLSPSDRYRASGIYHKSRFSCIYRMSSRIFNQVVSPALMSIHTFWKVVSLITMKSSTA